MLAEYQSGSILVLGDELPELLHVRANKIGVALSNSPLKHDQEPLTVLNWQPCHCVPFPQ